MVSWPCHCWRTHRRKNQRLCYTGYTTYPRPDLMFNRQALCMFRMLDDGHRLFLNDVLWKRGPKLSFNNCLCNSLGVLICVSGFWLSLRYWETWLYWVSVVCGRWCWGSLRCTYGLLNRFLMLTHCAGTCWYFPALNLTTQTSQQQRRLHMTHQYMT